MARGGIRPDTGRPVRIIAAMRAVDEGTTGPANSEHSTDASKAGLYRTASASPIGAVSRFARGLERSMRKITGIGQPQAAYLIEAEPRAARPERASLSRSV